jgi:hypothetical protein
MPPAVFSSAGAGFTITLSASGVTFNFLAIVLSFFVLMKLNANHNMNHILRMRRFAKVNEFHTKPFGKAIFAVLSRSDTVILAQMSIFQLSTGCLSGRGEVLFPDLSGGRIGELSGSSKRAFEGSFRLAG